MDLRGASAESVTVLSSELETAVSGPGVPAGAVADSLFAVARTLRSEAALRRFVTDSSVPDEAKSGLIGQLFGGKIDEQARELVSSAVTRRWTRSVDIATGIEHLGEIAAVRSAGSEIERLGDELFALRQAVQQNADLRDALADPARSVSDKERLLEDLLAGRALPATVTLAKQSVSGTYRTVTVALGEYQKVAASVQGEGVATVRVAKPLTEQDIARLSAGLTRQFGRPVHLNVVVDPEVLGGIKVEVGDHVIDGTIATRLDDARRALAG
ncbi:F0F1 ATP synthase subunit delta [Nocardioides insulae]|uniref:F0F1 ATP synthase subunit delta n=1 Tax=Nocardioides insulae TaxID=394734 RepID=UPI00042A6CB6|nr:F0F1 ATP synthase subunit delta [Nocardioides insulae]